MRKPNVRPTKIEELEKATSRHLGKLNKSFDSGELQEDYLVNADETHFIIHFDNGKTLGIPGDTEVRYADVTSGEEGLSLIHI